VTVSWSTIERELCRIPHVVRAHVVRDASEAVRELHIIATPGKPAKQVVRDVQSVAMAAFGLEVDRNVVSVVQLDDLPQDPPPPAAVDPPPPPAVTEQEQEQEPEPPAGEQLAKPTGSAERTLLTGMTLQSLQGRCLAWVVLSGDGREATGTGSRPATAAGLNRVVAEATLDALGQLHRSGLAVDIDTVEVRQLGPRRVALVSVVERHGSSEDALVGSATVRAAGELDAVARAVLDAVNRRFARA